MPNDDQPRSLSGVLHQLQEQAEGDKVCIDDLVSAFGNRAYGPMLLIPALLAIAPTGAIPGMSLLTGGIIFFIAIQLLMSIDQPWLPQRLRQFEFSRTKLDKALNWLKKPARTIEPYIKPRFNMFTRSPFIQIIALVCMLMALSMWPLALLPFAVAVPGLTVLLFGLGLTTSDGSLIVGGFIAAIAAVGLTVYALL